MADLPAISRGGFRATPVGLRTPRNAPIDDWLEYGKQLREIQGALRWVIGDWLNYGEHQYGEMYTQAYTLLPEYAESSIRHMRRVAAAFPLVRRRTGVSWSIHSELVKYSHDERDEILDMVESHELTREELRYALRDGKALPEKHACPICGKEHIG